MIRFPCICEARAHFCCITCVGQHWKMHVSTVYLSYVVDIPERSTRVTFPLVVGSLTKLHHMYWDSGTDHKFLIANSDVSAVKNIKNLPEFQNRLVYLTKREFLPCLCALILYICLVQKQIKSYCAGVNCVYVIANAFEWMNSPVKLLAPTPSFGLCYASDTLSMLCYASQHKTRFGASVA